MNFEDGYKESVEKTRKKKFNTGAGVGVLSIVALVLVASASSQ